MHDNQSLASTIIVSPPSSVAVDAFRKFLEVTKSEDIVETLTKEECWDKMEDSEQIADAINILTK